MDTHKKLHRSTKDKVIAGVAGGMAEYFNMDPVAMRLIFVVLAIISGGPMILAYILAWLIIPKDKEGSPVVTSSESKPDESDKKGE